jgi:hypothetical protein
VVHSGRVSRGSLKPSVLGRSGHRPTPCHKLTNNLSTGSGVWCLIGIDCSKNRLNKHNYLINKEKKISLIDHFFVDNLDVGEYDSYRWPDHVRLAKKLLERHQSGEVCCKQQLRGGFFCLK